jgi:hypothetical protein
VRGRDPEVDAVLVALATAAVASAAGSSNFRRRDVEPEVAPASDVMGSAEAADLLGLTDRAVRLACEQQRLRGEQVDGRWRIARIDVETFAGERQAS